MKRLFVIFMTALLVFTIKAQESQKSTQPQLIPLSSKQQLELGSLPELKLPASYKNKSLPYEVDNTLHQFYGGLFEQAGLSCGQAACVGMGFTYEINRVRNLDASLIENKYPTHFSWNWENGGHGWHGASYYHTLVMLKKIGNPNMQVYGGTHDFGGSQRWMSGYDAYYEAMHNRMDKAYQINCSTEEGILTLKHWINDHLEGAETGGIGFFYSQHQNPSTVLPAGTEHAGEKVVTLWGSSPNHAMTITGYNDSIRWDYNGDGQYTNHIDLNGDGIIDVRDWEIGGFKMNNTYGGAYNGWMMYRTLALATNLGGIWNNTVNVLTAIKEYSPSLTAKVKIYNSARAKLKILTGYSTNLSATEPDYYMTYPIIDYQGGDFGMQGADDEDSKLMEFGLDLTEFLNTIPSGTPVKIFFIVHEYDIDELGNGDIRSFSVIDYTQGSPVEYVSTQSNVAIIHNSVTSVSVVLTPQYDKPQITTNVLPNANVYHDYSFQMQADGGTPPYRWEFDEDYIMTESSEVIPMATNPIASSIVTLPFDFPFFGETYNYFYLTNRGLIDFTGESYTLPYNNNALSSYNINFLNRKSIAAFYSTTTCNRFYAVGDGYYIIRWTGTNIDVSLKLESNGNITIHYHNCNAETNQVWSSGLSSGDLSNYSLTPLSGSTGLISSKSFVFEKMPKTEIFELSESGLLTGVPTEEILAYPLNFKITDRKGIVNRKTIPISSEGLIIGHDIYTANNDLIEWGENVKMNITLRNSTEAVINNLNLTLSCDNENVSIIDNTEFLLALNSMQEIAISDAFEFELNYNFTDEEILVFNIIAQSDESSWELSIEYPVYVSDINYLESFVDDNDNNRMDIGETSDVYFYFKNAGGSALENSTISVSSLDPNITINTNTAVTGDFEPDETKSALFNFTASESCLPGHVAVLLFTITGANNYEKEIIAYISIGQIVEDWESNSFDSYNWILSGDDLWFVTEDEAFEGLYSLRSGPITHNQSSTFEIQVQVLAPGNISFYRKVSCELDANNHNWDYLAFYIDDVEKERWDGEMDWELKSYPVQAGIRTFKWVYQKDYTVSSYQDCAWIDFIEFPSIFDQQPIFHSSHQEINKTMFPDQIEQETLTISNIGGGQIIYDIDVLYDVPWLRNQRNITGSFMTSNQSSFFAGDNVEWRFTAKNLSPDGEWIEEVIVEFPEGFTITEITDVYDQGGDTLFLTSGAPGNGGEFSWFGQDNNGWGLIRVNETAYFDVLGSIDSNFEGNMTVYYTLQGEVYAAEPHTVNDSISLINFGPRVQWLYSDTNIGTLGISDEHEILLEFNTYELDPGIYECNIKIFTNIDTIVIPVSLEVLLNTDLNVENKQSLRLYPNPAKTHFVLESDNTINSFTVKNYLGQVIYSGTESKKSVIIGTENLIDGVYFIEVETKNERFVKKLVIQK